MEIGNKFLRRKQVEEITGLSRSSIYDMMDKALFPKQVKLGGRSVAWVESEVLHWINSKISERDGEQQ